MGCFQQESNAVDESYAWIILLAVGWLQAVVFGVINVSGVFFNLWLKEFKASRESIAWVLTMPMLFFYLFSPMVAFACRWFNSIKLVTFIAVLFMPLSLLLSSYVRNYPVLFLTHGVLLGFGMASVVPCNVMIVRYFDRHLSVALAVVTSCVYLGNFTMLPLTNYLLEKYDWRTAMQCLSFLTLITGVPSVFLYREHTSGFKTRSSQESFLALFKSARFWVVTASFAMLSVEYQTLSTHLVEYVYEMGITDINNVRMMPIYAAIGNILGRMLVGFVMEKLTKKMVFYKITLLITSLCAFMGIYCRTLPQMIVFLILYGIFEGGSKAQMSLVIVLTLGQEVFSEAFSLVMMFQTLFMVGGPVMVGKIVDVTCDYLYMIYILTAVPVIATLILQCLVFFKKNGNYCVMTDNNES